MSLEGEKLAARFSHNCWKARMKGICDLLKNFAENGTNHEEAVQNLQKLDSFAWYKIVASQNDIDDPFDIRVVKAYWIGDDDLIKKIEHDGRILLPFHNYTIFEYVHCSDLKEIDKCKVSVARAWKVEKSTINVRHRSIIWKGKEILLAKPELIPINRDFIHEIVKEEWITYHEGGAILKIMEEDAIKLIRRTEKAIKLFNEQQKTP